MICRRCGLEGAIDLDTGGQYHAEPSECIERQRERIAELEAERDGLREQITMHAQWAHAGATTDGLPAERCAAMERSLWKALEGE